MKPIANYILTALIMGMFILQSCKHEPFTHNNTIEGVIPSPAIDTTILDGVILYKNNCASCHDSLSTSTRLGATASQIQTAINTVGQMQSLSLKSMTPNQIKAIADALASQPLPTDGVSLYRIKCSDCHHELSKSSVGGASVSEIQKALKQKREMVNSALLKNITLEQIQAIAGALANVRGGDN